jgi:hypothetical protein
MGSLGDAFSSPSEFAVEPGGEHIGEEQAALFAIEERGRRGRSLAHGDFSERMAAPQQLAIDGADLVHDLAEPMIVGQTFGGLGVIGLGDVIHLGSLAIVTEGEVVLGAMTGAGGAFASRLAAGFVALDEGAPQQTIEGWQLAQELAATPAQSSRSLLAQLGAHRSKISQIVQDPAFGSANSQTRSPGIPRRPGIARVIARLTNP